jgi:hypothetical protein
VHGERLTFQAFAGVDDASAETAFRLSSHHWVIWVVMIGLDIQNFAIGRKAVESAGGRTAGGKIGFNSSFFEFEVSNFLSARYPHKNLSEQNTRLAPVFMAQYWSRSSSS